MQNELITIIVPIHNAEDYLPECIESIQNQTYTNLEILLVDDASTDSSGMICEEYAKKDKRIQVIHKEGKGEGGAKARNVAIERAKGDLLTFMDSDDYISKDMIKTMYEKILRDNSQGAVCSFHYVDKEKNILPWRTPQLNGLSAMTGKEAACRFLTTTDIEGFSWNKMFRREIIFGNDIRFDDSMNSFVDMYAMFSALLACRKVSFCEEKFYSYRQHEVSCVHTMSRRKLDNYRRVIGRIREKAEENGLNGEAEYFWNYRMIYQLFDFQRNKKDFAQDVWAEIKKDYRWTDIFAAGPLGIVKKIGKYLREDRMKVNVKVLAVWANFR